MKILALEFSSARRSVAVFTSAGISASASRHDPQRSTRAFALIDEVLQQARIDRAEIECIAVGLGPGSYTGIRVAISIGQGWQLGKGVKLLGISSADAIAEQAHVDGLTGHVTCAIDAQRQEFYVASYDLSVVPARTIEPLHIEPFKQVNERSARGEVLIGPEEKLPKNRLVFPDALVVARLASVRKDFVSGEKLEPIYLRETSFVKAPAARFPVKA